MNRTITEPREIVQNLVIKEEEGDRILYGHEIIRRIVKANQGQTANLSFGISYRCYVTFLSQRLPDCQEAQEAYKRMMAGICDYRLLEDISDRIELTRADIEELEAMNRYYASE